MTEKPIDFKQCCGNEYPGTFHRLCGKVSIFAEKSYRCSCGNAVKLLLDEFI